MESLIVLRTGVGLCASVSFRCAMVEVMRSLFGSQKGRVRCSALHGLVTARERMMSGLLERDERLDRDAVNEDMFV